MFSENKNINNKVILSIENLHKSYGNNRVLNGVSFNLKQSEILGIIGPSGSGKTTLLRCIDLLEHIDQGKLTYNDQFCIFINENGEIDVSDQTNNSLVKTFEEIIINVRKNIGLVFNLLGNDYQLSFLRSQVVKMETIMCV